MFFCLRAGLRRREDEMKIVIDTTAKTLVQINDGRQRVFQLYGREAFELVSHYYGILAWNQKYTYTFTWFGRPIIQLPDDLMRIQDVIYRMKPDVIIETGVAHGGSIVYYASLCKALQKGRVIGIDIEIRPHNRKAIEAHELSSYITLIEGDSVAPVVVDHVKSLTKPDNTTLLILDSSHTKEHVLAELEAYHCLVTEGSYIVVTDGIMRDLCGVPRAGSDWSWNNPVAAVDEFIQTHPEFTSETPAWAFNESELDSGVTHWPRAWLRKRSWGDEISCISNM